MWSGLDRPIARSANLPPCSELADIPSGVVAAATFMTLIDDVFDAMTQFVFTTSEIYLKNDRFSYTSFLKRPWPEVYA